MALPSYLIYPAGLFVVLFAIGLVAWALQRRKRNAYLQELCKRMVAWPHGEGLYRCNVGDRQVFYRLRWVEEERVELRCGITVRHAGPDFVVEHASLGRRLVRKLGLSRERKPALGDERVQSDFQCDGDPAALRWLFEETSLDRLMHEHEVLSCRLRDGVLWATRRFAPYAPPPELVRFVRERLAPFARSCERGEVQVRLRGSTELAKRFVWLGQSQRAHCPYCHDDLDLEGEDLVSCPKCETLHHGECFDEHGGCTVLGCTGSRRVA